MLRTFLSYANLIRSNFTSSIMEKVSENAVKDLKIRYDGRTKKRKWEDRRTNYEATEITDSNKELKTDEKFERVKKRKYALLLGYSGVDYFGMQRNPNMRTIEEDLFNALLDTNSITKDAFEQVQTIQFQRAARTDKGVSASRQIVSMKLPEELDLAAINDKLPEVIRIFGAKRVTKGFNSKSQCDARTYLYMLPTLAFASKGESTDLETFRIEMEKVEEVRELLKNYVGTKNYHNFTSKKKPNDPSATRYIMSFICEEPFIRDNVEFMVLKVKGQSFMLHQIRKMIGLCIAIIRGHTTIETLTLAAFNPDKVNIPRAPGLGLVLDYVHYDRYNVRYGADGMHDTLEWPAEHDAVQTFTEKYIYPTIVRTECTEKSMVEWLEVLDGHGYDAESDDDSDEKVVEEKSGEDKGTEDKVAVTEDKGTEDKVAMTEDSVKQSVN